MRPSGPATIPSGALDEPGHGEFDGLTGDRVDARPILLAPISVNHRRPSGPRAISTALSPAARSRRRRRRRGVTSTVKTPPVVIRPILFAFVFSSVNHSDALAARP